MMTKQRSINMKRKMKPNKKQNVRQPAEIMKDLTEARNRFAEAIRSQNYVMIEQFKKRIEMFENELEMAYAFINLCTEKITGDKHLISWGGQNAFSLDKRSRFGY